MEKGPCLFFLRECISSPLEICVQSARRRRRRVCRNVWIIQQRQCHIFTTTHTGCFFRKRFTLHVRFVSQIYSQNHFFRDCEFIRNLNFLTCIKLQKKFNDTTRNVHKPYARPQKKLFAKKRDNLFQFVWVSSKADLENRIVRKLQILYPWYSCYFPDFGLS